MRTLLESEFRYPCHCLTKDSRILHRKLARVAIIPAVMMSLNAVLTESPAAILRTEQMVGYTSGNLGASSTLGSLNGWNLSTAEVTLTNGSGSLIGTNLGLVVSEGDRAFISATQTNATGNPMGARNQFVPGSTFPQGNETNIYYSFLYKFNNAADVSPDGENLMQVNRGNSGINVPQHWNLVARNVGGLIQLGLSKAVAPNNATNYASTNIGVGQTIFVVVRQHIIPGVQNDIYDLWINPPREFYGTNDADVPLADASIGSLPEDGAEDGSGTGPGRFVVLSGANAEFDEFRVATTWAEATPWFGQCVSAAVAVSPVSVTQSAEINATFNVVATGTSPTVQWQRSSDSGANWSDIAGAVATTYTTPNLALNQSGNQYRAIVSVECNSSSATSAVATVTLTNVTPSSLGVVVNDTFLDTDLIGFDDRSNPPFSETNSLWYTAATDNLTAFGQGGNMLGIPSPGSSSLWLGYFTETNTSPVHLAVGRTLKVTLPFIANSFNSFTNNATLRLGLFDYYDSGNRIMVDGPNVGGSQGNAAGVRGYMLALNFGPTFNDTTPLEIFARNFLPDINLMGTTSDYESLGSGPTPAVDTNAPAFQPGVQYTLEFAVARTSENSVDVTTSLSGGGTNWSHTITDNNYAYHRFDAFGIRPNSLETSADNFTFAEFKVEVLQSAVTLPPFNITAIEALSPNAVKLTWESVSGATYHVLVRDSINGAETTNATIVAMGSLTSYTNSPLAGTQRYFRIATPPAAP